MLPPPKFESLEEAQEIIGFLWEKLSELEDRLNQNSQNSSVPPSKDRLGQASKKSSLARKSSGKKPGAQQGHKGHRRERHPNDDRLLVELHCPESHCHCGGRVISNSNPYLTHQVFDLPETAYTVLEHQVYQGQCCQCSEQHKAVLPATVSQTQMGAGLLSFIALQSGEHHQSIRKIQGMLENVFGLRFSTGAISEAQGRVSAMLTQTHQAIHQKMLASPLIMANETSHQRNNEKRWMWVGLSHEAAFFQTNAFRDRDAAIRLLGKDLDAILVTDQYGVYRYIDENQRQLCWAHILRNVAAIADSVLERNEYIGKRLVLLSLSIFRVRHRYEAKTLTQTQYYQRINRLRRSWNETLKKGTYRCSSRYRGRCKFLLKDDNMLWRFLENDEIPLTNNAAERVIRGYVLWRKCCYGVRSHRGELFRQRLLSLLETAKLLLINPYQWLKSVIQSCIDKTDYPIPKQLLDDVSIPCG